MRLLIDFLQDEMRQMRPVVDFQDHVLSDHEMHQLAEDGMRRTEKIADRLKNDPALLLLHDSFLHSINMISASPFPKQAKDGAVRTLIVEAIIMWENANNRFNEQFVPRE